MAAIQALRKNSWILTIVIGLALLAFIVTGLDTSIFSSKQSSVIAEVNGVEYDYNDYYKVFELYENQQKQSGQEMSYAQREAVYGQAWNAFLTGKLFEECYKNLGLSRYKQNINMEGISDAEFEDITIGENTDPELQYYFRNPNTGQFDKEMLTNVLSNLGRFKEENPDFYESWIEFEKSLQENSLRRKYVDLVASGVFVTAVEAEYYANEKNNQFDIEYVKVPYESIADSTITVRDSELRAYYKTISNEKRFKQEAGVSMDYVTFDIIPTPEDIEAVRASVVAKSEDFQKTKNDALFLNLNSDSHYRYNAKYYKKGELDADLDTFAFSSQVGAVTPVFYEGNYFKMAKLSDMRDRADSAKVQHILVQGENAAQKIDSLKTLVEAGADFAALARQFSADSGSAMNGGIIDWFREGEMVQSFQDSSFFGNVGKCYIAQSQFGIHLIKILDQGPKSKCAQVQVFAKPITYSQDTRSRAYEKAMKFTSENRTIEQFEASVEADSSLVKRQAVNTEENQRVIAGIDDSRQIIRWAHQNKDKEGEVSDVFRCGDKFVVVVITEVNKEGILSFESAEEMIMEEKKQEMKKEMLLKELGDAKSIQEVAAAKSLSVSTSENLSFASTSGPGLGVEPDLFATLSTMDKGVVTTVAGERGVFVAQVTNKKTEEVTTVDKEKTTQEQRASAILTNKIFTILKESADIEDNRINFF